MCISTSLPFFPSTSLSSLSLSLSLSLSISLSPSPPLSLPLSLSLSLSLSSPLVLRLQVAISNPRGISEQTVQRVHQECFAKMEEYRGEPVLYQLIEVRPLDLPLPHAAPVQFRHQAAESWSVQRAVQIRCVW